LIARVWTAANADNETTMSEVEVTGLLTALRSIWPELSPAKQERIVQLPWSSGSTLNASRQRK
jgi:hypothetical protein